MKSIELSRLRTFLFHKLQEEKHMRTTRKSLQAQVNRYNTLNGIQLKPNDDIIGGINLYTVDDNMVASGTLSEVSRIIEALTQVKYLER